MLRFRVLAACLALTAVGSCAPAHTPTPLPVPDVVQPVTGIPSRLSDTEFWALIEDVSEPGGYFRSDNILSNEIAFQTVIPELLRTTRRNDVYLGVGPEQNFTYIAALEPRMAIILDIRRGNLHMHLLYKALFELSADRAEFVSRLFSKARPRGLDSTVTADSLFNAIWYTPSDSALYRRNLAAVKTHLLRQHGFPLTSDDLAGIDYVYDAFYYGGPGIDYSYPRLQNNSRYPNYADLMVQNDGRGVQRSFLATEAIFRRIKDMETRNLIVPVVGDFGGPSAIRAVGDYLRAHEATVGAIYVSNVEQYLFQGDAWRRYYESVATLPVDSTTTFIRSVGGAFGGGGGGFIRLPSVLSSVQGLLAAYREGRIASYYDVIQISR